eukprot:Mycagemm_TRINITY_DN10373_c5_g3::TRINITY_DN10373_c5_g3_i5::g.1293::m.1293 type:complete len:112 gc:universal TRINITY_DN10373_c5_g3_i5:692-1027(+)
MQSLPRILSTPAAAGARSTPTASATRGSAALTAAASSAVTWVRMTWRRSISSSPALITAGASGREPSPRFKTPTTSLLVSLFRPWSTRTTFLAATQPSSQVTFTVVPATLV